MKPMIVIQTLLLSFPLAGLALHADCQKCYWFAKRTRNGEECSGPMKRLSRYVLPEVRMTGQANRESQSFCACPLLDHSNKLHNRNIPRRLYPLFDRLGRNFPNYRPGFRWCNSCAKRVNEESQQEPEYTPPPKVFPIF